MKKSLTLILVLVISSLSCLAQKEKLIDSIPKVNGNYEYQEVVKLDSTLNKEDLYKRAKIYFVESYKSAKDVIQYDEKSEGKIIGKGMFVIKDAYDAILVMTNYTWDVSFTTEIVCKDGRYRYRFYNIFIKQYTDGKYASTVNLTLDEAFAKATKGSAKKLYTRLLNSTITKFAVEQESIKSFMMKNNSTAVKDDF